MKVFCFEPTVLVRQLFRTNVDTVPYFLLRSTRTLAPGKYALRHMARRPSFQISESLHLPELIHISLPLPHTLGHGRRLDTKSNGLQYLGPPYAGNHRTSSATLAICCN